MAPTTPGIDAWGNLHNISGVTGKTNTENLSCSDNLSTNQLTSCYTYDAAGNLIKNGSTSYFYDAEIRLIATNGVSYVYDGNGDRVKKCTEGTTPGSCASNASGTFYYRGREGNVVAESDLSGNWTAAYGVIRGTIWVRFDQCHYRCNRKHSVRVRLLPVRSRDSDRLRGYESVQVHRQRTRFRIWLRQLWQTL